VKKPAPKVVEMASPEAGKPALIEKTGPLVPQLRPMVAASAQRVKALETEIAGLSLADLLKECDAPGRRARLVEELTAAKAEQALLAEAFATAQDRDELAENKIEIARLDVQFRDFETACAARLA
jgi:hypothetical protein